MDHTEHYSLKVFFKKCLKIKLPEYYYNSLRVVLMYLEYYEYFLVFRFGFFFFFLLDKKIAAVIEILK